MYIYKLLKATSYSTLSSLLKYIPHIIRHKSGMVIRQQYTEVNHHWSPRPRKSRTGNVIIENVLHVE